MSTFTAADFFEAQEAEAARNKNPSSPIQDDPESISLPDASDYGEEELRRQASRERFRQSRANRFRSGREVNQQSRSRSPGRRSDRSSHYRDRSRSEGRHGRRHDGDRPRSRRDNYYRPSPGRDDRDNTRRRDYGRLEPVNDDDFVVPEDKPRRDAAPPKRKERSQEEKDRSTVFIQQVAGRCRDKDLERFFLQRVGAVRAVQIVRDRVSGRPKGIAYVEFEDEASVEEAIKLTGQKLLDIPIIVQPTESEKNRRAKVETAPSTSNGVPFFRLYVGNIHFSVAEEDLEGVFAAFGQIEFVHLQKDDTGRSKGFAFVQFVDANDAKDALEKLQGFELAGRAIRVGLGNQSQRDEMATEPQQKDSSASTFGRGGRGQHAGGTGVFDRANGRDAEKTGGASALDDNDLGGVNFANYSREALMAKLARTETPTTTTVKPAAAKEFPEIVTRCICLKNMWSKDDTATKGWQRELEDDVGKECNDRYGIVVWVGIDPSSTEGEVYLKFDRPEGGKNAYRGLNGRFFGGRVITASYIVDAVYDAMFPKAAKV